MNETLNTIMDRCSVRSYTELQVVKSDLEKIMEAGKWAPNAMNAQQWHFSVVSDPELLQKMSDACRTGMADAPVPFLQEKAKAPDFHAFFHAPTVIVVTVQEGKFTSFDAGCAANSICIAARSLGYDTCITASTEFMFAGDPGLKETLHIPEGYQFVCAITLGQAKKRPVDGERSRKADVITYL